MPGKSSTVVGLFGFFAGAQAKTVVYNATSDGVLLKLKASSTILDAFSKNYLPDCVNITKVNFTEVFSNHSLWLSEKVLPEGPIPLRGSFARLSSMVGQASNSTALQCVEKQLSKMSQQRWLFTSIELYLGIAIAVCVLLLALCYCCLPKERNRPSREEPSHGLPLDPMAAPLLGGRT